MCIRRRLDHMNTRDLEASLNGDAYRVDFAKLSLRELDILATSPTREVRIAAKTERTRRSLKKR
jgi:hypothetical protein